MSVFISYRRDGGEHMATLIYKTLISYGYDAFLDTIDIIKGDYTEVILRNIEKADDIVIVLSKGFLDRCFEAEDPVRFEIRESLCRKRRDQIIPLELRGFELPDKMPLPSDINVFRNIHRHNFQDMDLFDSKMSRLMQALTTKPYEIDQRKVNVGAIYGMSDGSGYGSLTEPPLPDKLTLIPSPVNLIGRETLMDDIREAFNMHSKVILTADGGVGKTAVAAAICNALSCNRGNHVGWITSRGDLSSDLLQLRLFTEVTDQGVRKERIINWLMSRHDRVYLVIDDMDTVPSVKDQAILNSIDTSIKVLITSRIQFRNQSLYNIEVPLLVDKAEEVFYHYFGEGRGRISKSQLSQILSYTGYNTLLIELLARLARRESRRQNGVSELLRQLKEQGFAALISHKVTAGFNTHDEEMKKSVRDWIFRLYSISNIDEEHVRVLKLFSIMPANVEIMAEVETMADLNPDAIDELVELGWIKETQRGFEIHGIVKESLQLQFGDDLDLSDYGDFLDQLVDTENYLGIEQGYDEIARRLSLPEAVSQYFMRHQSESQDYADSNNDRTIDIARLYNNIAVVYSSQGRYKEAERYLLESIKIRQDILGDRRFEMASSYNNLANLYDEQGRYMDAERYYLDALRIKEGMLGREHPLTAVTYNNLAVLYDSEERFRESETYYQTALRIKKQSLHEDHTSIATTYNNLGALCYELGSFEKAEDYYRKALDMRLDILGSEHPLTAASYNNLAVLYDTKGKNMEAERYYLLALRIYETVLGENHPDTARIRTNLAALYQSCGRYEEAERCQKSALEVYERVFGKKHISAAKAYTNLGGLYEAQGFNDKAENAYQSAINICIESVVIDPLESAAIYVRIASFCKRIKRFIDGERYSIRAIEICVKEKEDEHPVAAKAYYVLASIYHAQERYNPAEHYYYNALEIQNKIFGEEHPDTKETIKKLEQLYQEQNYDPLFSAASLYQDHTGFMHKVYIEKGERRVYSGSITNYGSADAWEFRRED